MKSRRSSVAVTQSVLNSAKKLKSAPSGSRLTEKLGFIPTYSDDAANQETQKHLTDSESESDQEGLGYESEKKKKRGVWIADNFKRKDCIKYTPKPNTAKKVCYCGRNKRQHSKDAQNAEESGPNIDPCGTPHDLIQEFPTDAYGEMQFGQAEGINNRAKYIRLSDTTDSSLILELLMYYWKLPRPRLVLSITGGGRSFKLNKQDQDTFSRGIAKAAQTTNAWIITSGFNAGVPKIVGQTMRECQTIRWLSQGMEAADGQGLNCIGIAPWGYVSGSDHLVGNHGKGCYPARYKTSNIIIKGKPVPLNQNHSHFIFIDNGLRNEPAYGGEIKMRANIEGAIQAPVTESGLGLPVVLLVLEGGADTILNVRSSISQGIPTVVCDGTGRAADILAYAYQHTKEDVDGMRHVEESCLGILEEKIQISFGIDPDSDIMDRILENIDICVADENMITVFEMDEGENSDLDLAILTALLKGQAATPFYQLALSISWDRVDVAQKYICTDEVNWTPGSLDSFLMQAISANQVEFVDLFLEQGIVMKDFLTVSRLRLLYNTTDKEETFRHMLARAKGSQLSDEIFLHDVSLVLQHLLGYHQDDLYHNDRQQNCSRETLSLVVMTTALSGMNVVQRSSQQYLKSQRKKVTTGSMGLGMAELANPGMRFSRPFSELFLWALLTNRIKLAEYFWQQTETPIFTAILASCILNKMANKMEEPLEKTEYNDNAKKFEALATDVLDKCYQADGVLTQMMLDVPSETMGRRTVLSMAAEAKDMKFISHPSCQTLLSNIWRGGIQSRSWKIFIGILFPVFILMNVKFVPADNGKELKPVQKWKMFYRAPITRFWMGTLSYCCLVLLYSYVILSKFDQEPSVASYVLLGWIVVLLMEELRQAFFPNEGETVKQHFKLWLSNEWNNLDALFLLCTITGAILRNVNVNMAIPQGFYAVGCFLLYTRALRTSAISPHLGPLLVMIRKMIKESMGFLFILLVFLFGYGVASEALRHPYEDFSSNTIVRVLYQPYFQIYGELFLENDGEACIAEVGAQHCPEDHVLLPVMLAVYLLLGNVLLLNLLIAIFSSVYEEVQTNSLEIWKFEMYGLVMETAELPILPPPFLVFEHLFYMAKWALMMCKRCCSHRKSKDHSAYSKKQRRMLKLFEKECAADFRKQRAEKQSAEIPERIQKLDKKLENFYKLYEISSLEMTKHLQNLNKNLAAGLNLPPNLLDSPRKGLEADTAKSQDGNESDEYVSPVENCIDTVPDKDHIRLFQTRPSVGTLKEVREYDTVSQSSNSSGGDKQGKRKGKKNKKRTTKVHPEQQIDGVDQEGSRWANGQPGPPAASARTIEHQNSNGGTKTNKESNMTRSNKTSITMDQLRHMEHILGNRDVPIPAVNSGTPHGGSKPTQQDSIPHDMGGTVKEPDIFNPIKKNSIGSNSLVEINNPIPMKTLRSSSIHSDTNLDEGIRLQSANPSTPSTRIKAWMSVSVDHGPYRDGDDTTSRSNSNTNIPLSCITEQTPRSVQNTPNEVTNTPNLAVTAPRNPFSTNKPATQSDSPQILMANFSTQSAVSVEFDLPPNSAHLPPNSTHLPPNSAHLPFNSAHSPPNSTHFPPNSTHLPPNSAHFPPNVQAMAKTEEDSSDGVSDQLADDDRKTLLKYRKNKRRPKRLSISVDDYMKSLDKL